MVKEKKYDVVFFEAFEEEQGLLKKLCPKHIKADFTAKTIQESRQKEIPGSLISIRTQSKIPVEWAKDLGGILTRSTGYEHLSAYQVEAKTFCALGYLPSYCARAVAEQAIWIVLALLRKAKAQQQSFQSFCRDGLTGLEAQGKNMLVVGVGNIGSEVVDIAKGLRMNVAGVDIVKKIPSLDYVDLVPGLAWADIIVCACSLTSKTSKMLNYEMLRRVKNGTFFVNVARGEISPLKDLKKLLDENILGGLGLDVYENETVIAHSLRSGKAPTKDAMTKLISALSKNENVIFTPHNAFNTKEALQRKAEQTIESVVSFLTQGTFSFPVPEK